MYHLDSKKNSIRHSLRVLAVSIIGTVYILLCAGTECSAHHEINTLFNQIFKDSTDIFTGSTTTFSAKIGRDIPCKELEASLFVASSVLAAPVHHDVELQCVGDHDKNMQDMKLHFTAPDNKEISSYIWQIEHCPGKTKTCVEIKTIPFRVFPKDLLLPLKKWAEQHIIRLDDSTGILEFLFDHTGIDYQSTVLPVLQYGDDSSVLTLLGREEKSQKISGEPLNKTLDKALGYGPVILFQRNASNMESALAQVPAVIQTREKNNILIRTTLPVLPYLQDSPFAQSLLLELFELSQTPH
jgi:hypothetical protein